MICNIPVLSFSTALYCITLLVFIEVIVYCVIHVCNSVYVWPPESLFVREKHNNSQNITICLKLIYLLKKYVKIYIYIYVLEVCGWFLFGLYANLSQVIWVPYYRKWFQLNWKDGRLWFFFFFRFSRDLWRTHGRGVPCLFYSKPSTNFVWIKILT